MSACIKMSGISLKRRFIWRFLFHFTRHTLSALSSFYSAISFCKFVSICACIHSVVDQFKSSRRKFQHHSEAQHHRTEQNEGVKQEENHKRSLKRGKKFDDRPLHTSISKKVKQSNLLSFCVDMVRMCARVWLFACLCACVWVWQLPFSVSMRMLCEWYFSLFSQWVVSFAFTQLQTRWFSIVVRSNE